MAHYVLEYRYADMEARARVRARHLEYVAGLHATGRVLLAGPMADGSGALVIYQADDEAEVRRLVDQDPYTLEGVAADARIREWNVVIPAR